MWKPYLNVIHRYAGQALNVLDKFHIVAHLDRRSMRRAGKTPPSYVAKATA